MRLDPEPGTARRRVRYRDRSPSLGIAILTVSIPTLASGTGLLAAGFTAIGSPAGPTATGALGVAGGVVVLIMWAWFVWVMLRPPLILTAHTLRIPLLVRTRVVPLEEVAGVGLVFRRPAGNHNRGRAGWYVTVWPADNPPLDIRIAYRPASWAGRPVRTDTFDPVRATDAGKLAATHAAWVAREVHDRVLAVQGPSGFLATRQQQKHIAPGAGLSAMRNAAFWSPDGELGYAGRSGARVEDSAAENLTGPHQPG